MKTNAVFVVDGVCVGTIKIDDGALSLIPATTEQAVWEALGSVVAAVHSPARLFNPPTEETT